MKTHIISKTLIVLVVVIGVTVRCQGQPSPTPVSSLVIDSSTPAGIPLGSPAGQVLKLVQAGVDVGVIETYITNCPSAFNLDADKIISLTDAGVSSEMVSAMFAHDKALPLPAASPAVPAASAEQAGSPPPAPAASAESTPPSSVTPTDLNLNEIDQTLTPYGTWVQVDGYGRCWRPNVVVYNSTWQPYCDRGRWVYTDYGWYWNSDYAWGVTFHYGRWFNSPRYGWCWWPDTVWAPSWVTWRSNAEYCGWAPLPPFSVYQPGIGFLYRGNNVTVSFGFGLASSCFTFVSVGNFCQPYPRYHCVPHQQVTPIYNQTTIVNNYGHHNQHISNGGVSVTIIGNATHHPIQPVPIGTLVNPGHHGWHGQNINNPGRHFGADNNGGSGHGPSVSPGFHHESGPQNGNHNGGPNGVNYNHHSFFNMAIQTPNQSAGRLAPGQSLILEGPGTHRVQPQPGYIGHNFTESAQPRPATPPSTTVNRSPATAPVRNQPQNNNWVANGGVSPQNLLQFTQPVASQRPQTYSNLGQHPRQVTPRPVISAPTGTTVRPRISTVPQHIVRAAPRIISPAPAPVHVSPAPRQLPNAGNPSQGWAMRNH